MSNYEILTLLLQAVVAIAAFVSLSFLYRQVRVMFDQILVTQEASRAQSALAIVSFLQSQDVRSARHCVRSVLSTKSHSSWSNDDKTQAALVCANYDVAAGLLRANLALVDLIVNNWGPSIVHCHQVLSPYMADIRSQPGGHPEYWGNFDWLCSQIANCEHYLDPLDSKQ